MGKPKQMAIPFTSTSFRLPINIGFKNFLEKNYGSAHFASDRDGACQKLDVAQRIRKEMTASWQDKRQKYVMSYLNLPENQKEKKLFDNIRACETTPINQNHLKY